MVIIIFGKQIYNSFNIHDEFRLTFKLLIILYSESFNIEIN